MNQLLGTDRLYFHKYPVGIRVAFILANRKWLATFRRSLVNNIKF